MAHATYHSSVADHEVRVSLLGPVAVWVDGAEQPLSGVRIQTLITLIALRHPRPVAADELTEAITGRPADPRGRNALHQLVLRLRRALPDGVVVSDPSDGYRLGTAVTVDLVGFRELAREAIRTRDAATAADALELVRGRPLDGGEHNDALDRARHEIDWLCRELRRTVAIHADVTGTAALLAIERSLADDPLDDHVAARRVDILVADGRLAAAVRAGRESADHLAEAGLAPGPALDAATRRAYSAFERRPPRQVEVSRRLIGRDAEVSAVVDHVLSGTRLVVVIGPPGAGTTSVATAAAARLNELGWDLVDAGEGDHGLRDGALTVIDGATSGLESRVARVLASPRGSVIVAGRGSPGLEGEATVRVGPLADAPATELLLAELRRIDRRLSDFEQALLPELVRVVGALPLGLRLAANRLRDTSVDAVIGDARRPSTDHAGDPLVAVATASLDALPSHLHDLLVAVSPWLGPFGTRTVRSLVPPEERGAVPRRLAALAEASLIEVDDTAAGTFRLLPPIRTAVLARLDAALRDAAFARYAHHMAVRARWLLCRFGRAGEAAAAPALRMCAPDLEQAFEVSLACGHRRETTALTRAVALHLVRNGRPDDAVAAMERAVRARPELDDPELLFDIAAAAYSCDRYADCLSLLERYLASPAGPCERHAALGLAGRCHRHLGQFDRAHEVLASALADADTELERADAGLELGMLAAFELDRPAADERLTTAQEQLGLLGIDRAVGAAVVHRALLAALDGSVDLGGALLRLARVTAEDLVHRPDLAYVAWVDGWLAARSGEWGRAARRATDAEVAFRSSSAGFSLARALELRATAEHHLGHDGAGRVLLREAGALRSALSTPRSPLESALLASVGAGSSGGAVG